VPFTSKTHYYGVLNSSVTRHRTETRTVRSADGKSSHTETVQVPYQVSVYRPEDANFNRDGRENIIGRKHTAFYGFDNFQSTLFLDNIVPFKFETVKKNDAEFINAEVDSHESQINAFGRVEDGNRAIAAGKVQRLVRCDSVVNIGEPIYVHAPLWVVRYKFEDKIYKVSAAGDSGKIVKGEIPLSKARRMKNFIIGVALLIIFGIIGNIGLNMYTDPINSQSWGVILTLVSAIVMIGSFFFTKTAFQVQLEKSETKDIHKDRKQAIKQKAKDLKAMNEQASNTEPSNVEATNPEGGV
jgi:hypothetical protein